jgi:ABC-type multidrug transport system ATPase subunit
VQGWTSGAGYPSMFQCSLSQCSSTFETIDGKQRFKYNCQKSSCGCTVDPVSLCNPLVPPAFAEIKGLTEFVFDETTDNIVSTTITPRDLDPLQGRLVLLCNSGECGTPYSPPVVATNQPDNAGTIVPIVVIPAVIIGLAIVPIIAYACLVSCGNSAVSAAYPLGSVGETARPSKLKLNGVTLTLKGVSYFVERSTSIWPWGKSEKMQILHDINCEIRPGRLTAILGASGAGKTTTLDIIAGYEKLGKVKGDILLNGQPLPSSYRYMVGYVLQEDRMIGTLTVEEHLLYTALLRLPESVSYTEKRQIVTDLIEEFGLDKVRSSLIGDEASRGISSGEMRRVSIATELITKPRVLICDEPTSGLDAYNALSVMEALKRVAERGCTVIASIHQPRSSIFNICDDALVLWNGKTVFSGRTKNCIKFLSKHGFECPDDFNVADFISMSDFGMSCRYGKGAKRFFVFFSRYGDVGGSGED